MNLQDLPIEKNYVRLKKLLSDTLKASTNPPAAEFGKPVFDFANKRLVSANGKRAIQWAPEGITAIEGTFTVAPPAKKEKKAKKVKAPKAASKKKAGKARPEDNIVLIPITEDPNRPKPPRPEDLPVGMSWLRRNLPASISAAMPEDIRPNGPGRLVSDAEAKLAGHGFWDIVSANPDLQKPTPNVSAPAASTKISPANGENPPEEA